MQSTINYIFADAAETLARSSSTICLQQLRTNVLADYPQLTDAQTTTALDSLCQWGWEVNGLACTASR